MPVPDNSQWPATCGFRPPSECRAPARVYPARAPRALAPHELSPRALAPRALAPHERSFAPHELSPGFAPRRLAGRIGVLRSKMPFGTRPLAFWAAPTPAPPPAPAGPRPNPAAGS